jgi:hypothetical protein
MVSLPDISAGKAAIGTGAGAAATEVTVGLERAWQAAGDTLGGIFGGAPWELSPAEIVDAVGGGAPEGASMVADAVVVMV